VNTINALSQDRNLQDSARENHSQADLFRGCHLQPP